MGAIQSAISGAANTAIKATLVKEVKDTRTDVQKATDEALSKANSEAIATARQVSQEGIKEFEDTVFNKQVMITKGIQARLDKLEAIKQQKKQVSNRKNELHQLKFKTYAGEFTGGIK